MKKVVSVLLATMLVASTVGVASVEAGGQRHRQSGDAAAAAVFGTVLSAIIGSALSQQRQYVPPRYAPPAARPHYGPPPVRPHAVRGKYPPVGRALVPRGQKFPGCQFGAYSPYNGEYDNLLQCYLWDRR
jgi:hypothetical protein